MTTAKPRPPLAPGETRLYPVLPLRDIVYAAERDAHEVAASRLRDRLAERGLADPRRTDQAQDRPGQLVGS
jgi:hypothetical protein